MLGRLGRLGKRWSRVLRWLRLLRVLKLLLLRILRVRMCRDVAVRGPKARRRRLHHGRHGEVVVSLQPGGLVEAPKFVIRRTAG